MSSSGNGRFLFELSVPTVIARKLRQLMRRAIRESRDAEFLSCFQAIVNRLKTAPRNCGEALYRLPALRLQIRSVVVGPVHVHFAVHQDRPLVFLKAVGLLGR